MINLISTKIQYEVGEEMEIILASKSPRRREILENTKVRFSIEESQIDEVIKLNELPKETVMRLAYEKALDVANRNRNSLVIGADTIVVINDTILGKPKDDIEAFNMLKLLSGKTHYVITGFALIKLVKLLLKSYQSNVLKIIYKQKNIQIKLELMEYKGMEDYQLKIFKVTILIQQDFPYQK